MLFLGGVVKVVHLLRITMTRHKSAILILSVAVLTVVRSLLVVTAVHLTVAIAWTDKEQNHV